VGSKPPDSGWEPFTVVLPIGDHLVSHLHSGQLTSIGFSGRSHVPGGDACSEAVLVKGDEDEIFLVGFGH